MSRSNKTKTLYSTNKNVDISSILTNKNIINQLNTKEKKSNINLIQTGGDVNKINKKKSNKSSNKNTKKNKDDNEDLYSINESEYGDSDNDDEIENDDDDNDDDNIENDDDNLSKNKHNDYSDDEIENDEDNDSDDINDNDDNKSIKSMQDDNSYVDEKEEKDYIDNEETLKSKCYAKYAKLDYDELDFDELFGEETLTIDKNIKLTKPILTKYEFVRLLTDRTKQLAQGAKPMLKNIQGLSSKEIAKLELKNKIIPLIVERPVPNSHAERWKLTELEIPDYLFTN